MDFGHLWTSFRQTVSNGKCIGQTYRYSQESGTYPKRVIRLFNSQSRWHLFTLRLVNNHLNSEDSPLLGRTPETVMDEPPLGYVSPDNMIQYADDSRYPLINSHDYGQSLFSIGKSTISMAMFNSFLYVYQAG